MSESATRPAPPARALGRWHGSIRVIHPSHRFTRPWTRPRALGHGGPRRVRQAGARAAGWEAAQAADSDAGSEPGRALGRRGGPASSKRVPEARCAWPAGALAGYLDSDIMTRTSCLGYHDLHTILGLGYRRRSSSGAVPRAPWAAPLCAVGREYANRFSRAIT